MDESNVQERNDNIVTARDNRRSYAKQVAVHLILASIFFECIAFYILSGNLPLSLNFNETLNWTVEHAAIPEYIFNGKQFSKDSIHFNFLLNTRSRRRFIAYIRDCV